MTIYVDIDETICFYEGDRDYELAIPLPSNISKINKLYEKGHEIIYWTARGTVTGIDWSEATNKQFKKWGVKHTSLKFGKPPYDLLICDKSQRIEEI
jgi:CMP-N,N'-diacetyllegionaminic acid synthase